MAKLLIAMRWYSHPRLIKSNLVSFTRCLVLLEGRSWPHGTPAAWAGAAQWLWHLLTEQAAPGLVAPADASPILAL